MHYFDLIAEQRILPDVVESIPTPKTYKVRVPAAQLTQQWPTGMRIFFRVNKAAMQVGVIDLGDHRTSATHPGRSIYPDER